MNGHSCQVVLTGVNLTVSQVRKLRVSAKVDLGLRVVNVLIASLKHAVIWTSRSLCVCLSRWVLLIYQSSWQVDHLLSLNLINSSSNHRSTSSTNQKLIFLFISFLSSLDEQLLTIAIGSVISTAVLVRVVSLLIHLLSVHQLLLFQSLKAFAWCSWHFVSAACCADIHQILFALGTAIVAVQTVSTKATSA